MDLIKQDCFLKVFPKSSNLDDAGISLSVFLFRTNLQLHNISVTPKMLKKFIANLYSLKRFGPDCIQGVDVKNDRVFEKPVNNRIDDHLEKCDLFSDF